MRILIIEDEIKTARFLHKGLSENGFIVDMAHDGEDGLFRATHQYYDLIILDVMLPKQDGWSIIRTIKAENKEQRILFLTARDDIEDRVKGLELGADDYLIKPFAFSELLARVRSLLRRGTVTLADKFCIDDLTIEMAKHKVTRNNQRISLSPKEFALLVFFAQHKGEVLSRTLIAERVWDINFDCDTNTIDVAVRRLRQKIDEPFDGKLIQTIRGVGYVFGEPDNE